MKHCALGLALTVTGVLVVGCGGADPTEENTTRDSAGAIVEGGDLGAFRIQVGDCLGGSVAGEVQQVQGVPCESAHQSEVYHSFELASGDGTFPGTDAVQPQADQGCLDAFEGFVGIGYGSSDYEISTLVPTAESWDGLADREVLCLIGQPEGTLTTGTIRGTAR